MEELQEQVAAFQSRWYVARTVQVVFYTSSVGQNYAILVTKKTWYKVRIFVKREYPTRPSILSYRTLVNGERNKIQQYDLFETEHWTWYGVQDRIYSVNKFFGKPDFRETRRIINKLRLQHYPIIERIDHFVPRFVRVPRDYASNPDKYLKRGDIIAVPFAIFAVHTGIYLGNGQVGHVSGHGGGKDAGVARIGKLLGDFTKKGTETIWILYLPLRIRTGEEIAKKAEKFAANEFRKGDYHLIFQNCQHFVFLCATGVEFRINFLPDSLADLYEFILLTSKCFYYSFS